MPQTVVAGMTGDRLGGHRRSAPCCPYSRQASTHPLGRVDRTAPRRLRGGWLVGRVPGVCGAGGGAGGAVASPGTAAGGGLARPGSAVSRTTLVLLSGAGVQ